MRLRFRLPLAFALTTLVFAGIVALTAALVLRGVYLDRLEDDMSSQIRQFAAVLEEEARQSPDASQAYLQTLTDEAGKAGGLRLTLIAHDGTVLADSEADPATLDNHAGRPEVAQALAGHEGRSRRLSATLGHQEVYVAIPLPAGEASWSEGALRGALPASSIDAMLAASWRVPLIVWAILLLPTLAVSYLLTRSITRPLERLRRMTEHVASGDLAHRTSVRGKDELGQLAGSLNAMAAELESRVDQLAAEEERSAQVLAAMSDGVVVLDDDGSLVRANPAAGRILGVSLEGAEGSPLVLAARAFPARALTLKAEQAGRPITEVLELPGNRPGNRYLAVEVVPLQASGLRREQTLFVIRDETARVATERMRRDFATNVSHELKTPLAGLSLLAETLKHAMREDAEQADVFLGRLSAEIGRLTELTDDLLTLSRIEEEHATPEAEFVRVDLARLAAETARELESHAIGKNQQLAVSVGEETAVIGDDVALRTLVRNLLDNAIRYTEPGGHISLTLSSESSGDGERWVVLTVKDDGVGIPLAEQNRIFERFYRIDKARSRETGGTGLGLSIVRHVAERHGGRVEVASTVGVGSTFTVHIPAA
jgi:two-component system phosphate regulon sensor histidine kinase PhoR